MDTKFLKTKHEECLIVFKIMKSQQRRVRKESQFVMSDPGLQTGTD